MDAIIARCRVCRLGLCDNGEPYVVPVCFGYEDGVVYVHAANSGRKLDVIASNPRVCVEFDIAGELVAHTTACGYGMNFESVIGWGVAQVLTEVEAKTRGLNAVMRQYSGRDWEFGAQALGSVTVLAIRLERVSGKSRRIPPRDPA